MGKNSVFWKWMVSYMAVMLVFLLCNSITYWQGKRILVQNQETENDKIVEQIRTNLTDMEETMRDLSYSVLAQDDTILLGKIHITASREARPVPSNIPVTHCVNC